MTAEEAGEAFAEVRRAYSTAPKRLSHRAAGEDALVATQKVNSSGAACTRRDWRSVVKPLR